MDTGQWLLPETNAGTKNAPNQGTIEKRSTPPEQSNSDLCWGLGSPLPGARWLDLQPDLKTRESSAEYKCSAGYDGDNAPSTATGSSVKAATPAG